MNFFEEGELKHCFGLVRDVEQHYCQRVLADDHDVRSVEDLLWICRTYLAKKIQVDQLDIHKDTTEVWGAMWVEHDGYRIYIVDGLDDDWTRFVVTKELFHVILDNEAYRSLDIGGIVQQVKVALPFVHPKPSAHMRSEVFTEIAAMEFLFPYGRRVMELSGSNKDNFAAIAARYKIPQVMVDRYLAPDAMEELKGY